jgi:glycosyltransferase involved in cell wall biosynthesis
VILAFAQVVRTLPEAYLVVASNGNELDAMKELARRSIPSDRYEFVGFVPEGEMRRFYSELDLFLFPSRYGFGMSAIEATACGTPAIVARTLDSTDFFKNDLSLVDPNSPDDLAGRILLLLKQRESYDDLRRWGLESVRSLSWTAMAQRYVEFWSKVRASIVAR